MQVEPSLVRDELPSANQGEHHSSAFLNPTVHIEDTSAGYSQVEGELRSPTTKSSDVVDIPSTTAVDQQLSRLHVWTKDHPPGEIFGNPYASVHTRSSHHPSGQVFLLLSPDPSWKLFWSLTGSLLCKKN